MFRPPWPSKDRSVSGRCRRRPGLHGRARADGHPLAARAGQFGRADYLDTDLIGAVGGRFLNDFGVCLARCIGSHFDRRSPVGRKSRGRAAGYRVFNQPARTWTLIRLPHYSGGENVLFARGIDGRRRESPGGVGPIDGGRFRPLRRADYFGSGHGNGAYAFNRRGDLDPPLTGQDGYFLGWRGRSAFYLFVSGNGAADAENAVDQAGPL